jgi:hypothetical protein
MITVRKISLTPNPVRPRTDEAVIVTRANGDRVRFEFDYDESNIYVYAGLWPKDWPKGIGCKVQLPVRAIPRSIPNV